MKAFIDEADIHEAGQVETVWTTLFTISIREVEKDIFLCLILSHENLYSDNSAEHQDLTLSNFTQIQSLFREEDTHIFKDTLNLYHDLFKLFHHSITELFEKDINLL